MLRPFLIVFLIAAAWPAVANERATIRDRAGRIQGHIVERPDGRIVIEDTRGREKYEVLVPRERVDPRTITDPDERHYQDTLDTIMGRPWSRK